MKAFMTVIALFVSSVALAKAPEVTARTYYCQELKNFIAQNDKVIVRFYKNGRFKKMKVSASDCSSTYKTSFIPKFETMDSADCAVGFACKFTLPEGSGDTSSTNYGEGWGGFPWPSGGGSGSSDPYGGGENYGGYDGNGYGSGSGSDTSEGGRYGNSGYYGN